MLDDARTFITGLLPELRARRYDVTGLREDHVGAPGNLGFFRFPVRKLPDFIEFPHAGGSGDKFGPFDRLKRNEDADEVERLGNVAVPVLILIRRSARLADP
ncbi:hypothetical protein WBP07_12025 [Novosphingobium sp. BL-8A]|uniref:hypothetical protein n=1 Tax=Novosphingobium sp. BL-8A TaxID=3127639 RepID=UPI0037573B29